MDPAIKKKALRKFTYGLYLVTTAHGDDRGAFRELWRLSAFGTLEPAVTPTLDQGSAAP